MQGQRNTKPITPELRRELLAAWDAATVARFSTAVSSREYRRRLDRLTILWWNIDFSFPMPPGLTGKGY